MLVPISFVTFFIVTSNTFKKTLNPVGICHSDINSSVLTSIVIVTCIFLNSTSKYSLDTILTHTAEIEHEAKHPDLLW